MTEFRQYLLTLICVSLLCSLIPLFGGTGGKPILRLVCGVFLTVTIVAPVMRQDWRPLLNQVLSDQAAQQVAQQGKLQASDAMTAIIKEETEAYILDKARLLGLELKVTVQLKSEELPVPVSAVLQGQISREQKSQLEAILTRDLGIPKEAQQWISG